MHILYNKYNYRKNIVLCGVDIGLVYSVLIIPYTFYIYPIYIYVCIFSLVLADFFAIFFSFWFYNVQFNCVLAGKKL